MTDLKPCPFCGGEAVVCGYPTEQMVYVKCRECGACSFGCQTNEEKAAAAWNQRAERTCNPVNVDREDEDGCLHRMFHRCSECGHDLPYEAEKGHGCYCPHCGARVVS